jgi:hypothetical protein
MRTLLLDIEDFLSVYPEVTPAALGRAAVKDSYLVEGLRRGRSPRETTGAKVRAWMADYTLRAKERESSTGEARQRVEEMARQVRAAAAAPKKRRRRSKRGAPQSRRGQAAPGNAETLG